MKFLQAPTESFIEEEYSELAADATAGSSVSLTLKNNDSITTNDYVVIGQIGTEKAELQQVSGVSGDTGITVGTLKFDHSSGEPVTKYRFNQRKFYGATSKEGTYNELTSDGSPVDIQVDDPQGTRLEYTGNEGYTWFKAIYYNSTDGSSTSLSDAEPVEADESKRYTSLYNIRRAAGLVGNQLVSDLLIETKRQQAENEIDSAIFTRYSLPLSEVPTLIENVCTTLAAGYIHYEEYPEDDTGKKLLGEARGILKAIQNGKQRLLDSDKSELTRAGSSTGTISGKPDGTETGDDKRAFTRDIVF